MDSGARISRSKWWRPALRSGPDLARELLADPDRRPAIVYTPSRKQAESVAALLAGDFPTAAYHAGLDAERRRRVQDGFLGGKLEVIVATIAFGMGIDKANIRSVIHTALPGSIEAYYQEIGRAGRDGEPSRAILMHSYADRYTHDFFFERDYPDVKLLDQIYARLRPEPQPREFLEKQSRIPGGCFREGAGEAVGAWRRGCRCDRMRSAGRTETATNGAIRISRRASRSAVRSKP